MKKQVKITDSFVKKLSPPPKGNKITYDTEVKGFGVRVTAGGVKSFIINYYVARRERRFTIGQYPEWSVAAARDEAKAQKREIDRGFDPLGKRNEERDAKTVQDLWEAYEERHLPSKADRSAADDKSMWENYILPKFRNDKIADLTTWELDAFHKQIGKTKPTRANRVMEIFRKALNLAIRWEWISRNPADGFKRFDEDERLRHLSNKELEALTQALAEHRNQSSCNAIRLLFLTGARKMEVLGAQWNEFDFEQGVWTKPRSSTKQKRIHRVPLSGPALTLLSAIKEKAGIAKFVFPSHGKSGHLTDVKRTWEALQKNATLLIWRQDAALKETLEALSKKLDREPTYDEIVAYAKNEGIELPTGLTDARLHDARHTFASLLAGANQSLPIISALLGHSQPSTTQRYVHFIDDPLRRAVEEAAFYGKTTKKE